MIYPLVNDRTGDPKPRVTQVFGARPDYYAQFGLKNGHEGEDYGAWLGQSIWASAPGMVVVAKSTEAPYHPYGVYCWVDHGEGYRTAYCHLSRLDVALYQQVQAGQQVGLAGRTGNADGVHLHLTLTHKDDQGVIHYRNPALYYGELAPPLPVTLPADAKSKFRVINPDGLNVRTIPSKDDSRVLTLLPNGTVVYLNGQQISDGKGYRWLQLASPQNHRGISIGGMWVALDYNECKTTVYGTVSLLP